MALVTNIVIDLVSTTAVLNCTVGSDLIENITYQNSDQSITLDERGEITISGAEFLSLQDQIKIFETAILFNFSPNQFATIPFDQIIVNETKDTGSGEWNLAIDSVSDPKVFEYKGVLSSIQVDLGKRSPGKTITFPEWIKTLVALNHYQISIRNYFSL